ncbi:MAG: TetR/AcrR family transcriptional regulator [Solirubrobacteraceae bacterium]|jgi:AcrR family transcriptional regulator
MPISRSDRKETQRERLLAGMLFAAVRNGYERANIAQTIAHAGVSRPTFYEYFTDKDDCFLAVHREISDQLLERVNAAVQAEPPDRAVQAGVRALILRAEARPDRARFLVNETLAGGHRVLDEHDRTIEEVEQIIEKARAKASPQASTPDVPTRALVGGVCGLLAPRLRRNQHDLHELADEITTWIDGYCQPTEHHRWRTLDPGPVLPPPEHVLELVLRTPPPLPPGRPSIPSAEVTRNQRERILYATANVAARKGYTATTIADITTAAGMDRRVFYANFRDKQQAFLAIHEFGFQQMMAACASGFFSGSSWPDRIWEGIRAGAHFNATYPVLAQIGYIEAHAVGSPAIQRVEDSQAAFKIFLQEGYQHAANPPPRTVLDAIAATIFEIGYHSTRTRQVKQLPGLTPHAVYLALTPFLGRAAANDFIDEKAATLSTSAEPYGRALG